jgi:hypothetical protein
MPTAEENVKFLFLVLTDNGQATVRTSLLFYLSALANAAPG